MDKSISLSGQVYMLGIRPEKGGLFVAVASAMNHVLTGALFLELYQNGNIDIKNNRVIIRNPYSKNKLHLFILKKLKKKQKKLKVTTWINRLHFSMSHIRNSVQNSLARKGALRLEEKRFLFFTWRKPFLVHKNDVFKLISEIKSCVNNKKVSEYEVLFLSLIQQEAFLKRVFPARTERKKAKLLFRKIIAGNDVSKATAQAIAGAQAVNVLVAGASANS